MGKNRTWKALTDEEKDELAERKRVGGANAVEKMAEELGMKTITLNRYLQIHKKGKEEAAENAVTIRGHKLPSYPEVFEALKNKKVSLVALADQFKCPPSVVRELVSQMRQDGYIITEGRQTFTADTARSNWSKENIPMTLADQLGQRFIFGAISDTHAGSSHAQPSAINRFVDLAYDRGVRHILVPGDVSAGIFGYRGQHLDQVPGCAPDSRATAFMATRNQMFLADVYFPKREGLTYYLMGGNHDYWHITNAGIDLVYMLCQSRKDMVYLGYDAADIPLTDKADVRLWHPTGGVPYALSYRTQKGLENMAFQELAEAVYEQKTPNMRMLIAGHLHIEVKFQRGPFVAAQIGCFEGQTNYLKRKGLYPEVGGAIFEIKITDGGVIQETGYTFMNFQEIAEDWMNWPVPEDEPVIPDPDEVDVLFKFVDYQEAV